MQIMGVIAVIVTLVLVAYGLTSQIYRNYKNKNTRGLSLSFFFLGFMSWCVWSIYGWMRGDFFIGFAQTVGGAMNAVILLQFWLYRKK
ncbi:MAG: hypothetical protein A2745_01350 [Candidatus Harrisonbacteria bacterium RIFCSPHIGHO2_01_FULL_44_13]|uniref:MtN3 and saliva related transmembrane protein n=1 Tax=Candidatus Harrisonbacteria bacterium RIFCSPLOWO2_01_FULL_44_18 TaxID=1798407 RepID=A0A1G1ZNR4_9BACT|nr:MAG: hypothetical protein A2745_01350 [Candidatus Harrisonbacteria bacterium RIFCSPHIGHO2_01_FULL_44_13]OGY66145.1 MAG: hypothetical protein A3A16_02445 [Candidatus Harrisonbacteria bacterium RIFCSPLOWO2_01_FULL_44_18]